MIFNNPQAIREHPQVSKIPYNVLRHIFNMYDFPDYLLLIMKADHKEIDAELKKNSTLIKSKSQKNARHLAWLAIAYSHPDMSNLRLLEIARFLSLSEQETLVWASLFGNLSFFNYLTESLSLENVRDKIKAENFKAFWLAASGGHLALVDRLIQLASADVQNMIQAENFQAFKLAACGGHLSVIHRLIQLAPDDVQNMIQAENFQAFKLAAYGGHLPVIERLIAELGPANEVQNMIQSGDFRAFRWAAENGHLTVIARLIQSVPANEVQKMIQADDFEAFCVAARGGHLSVIDRLIVELVSANEAQNMIKAQNFRAFYSAACWGHLAVIERLIQSVPANEAQNMVKAQNFRAFSGAARGGHLAVIERLIKLAPAEVQNMIQAEDFEAFRNAGWCGHLAVIERLIKLAPTEVENMIQAENFEAFRVAASGGHLALVDRLIQLAQGDVQNMIQAENFEAFRAASKVGHLAVIERLLSYPTAFAFAEMHVHEYGNCVNPLIDKKLGSLRDQKRRLEQQARNELFDIIDSNEANLLFYVLRNLIRRNEARLQNDILFLLNIPSVRSLAHTTDNELLQLALASHNQGAIGLLLNILAVLQLAEANDFYHTEALGGFNLRELAQRRESSMTALSQGEQKRLARAIDRYKPMIDASGVAHIMTDLRTTLDSRYEDNPAIFVRQEQTCTLPLQWKEFQELGLNPQEKIAAMAAYAQHKDHTASRYLSKPNPWMHHGAAYVNVNPATQEMWSTFEQYQQVISLYYLAAVDTQSPPTDGYTLETRLEGFIDELAFIGRAHNWDNTRFKTNKSDEPIRDEDSNPITEEYDDFEGDRPSCSLGVKRRLFQSVRGHSLLTILTKSIIDAELRELIRSHFRKSVNQENCGAIRSAWNKIIMADKEYTQDEIAVLTSLNISEEEQGRFIANLIEKYQEQFDENPSFLLQINMKFSLKENEFHVNKFCYCLMDYFEETRSQVLLSAVSFFETEPSVQNEQETQVSKKSKGNP